MPVCKKSFAPASPTQYGMNRAIRRAPCGSLRFVADAGRIVAAWGGSTFGALPSETVVRRPHRNGAGFRFAPPREGSGNPGAVASAKPFARRTLRDHIRAANCGPAGSSPGAGACGSRRKIFRKSGETDRIVNCPIRPTRRSGRGRSEGAVSLRPRESFAS